MSQGRDASAPIFVQKNCENSMAASGKMLRSSVVFLLLASSVAMTPKQRAAAERISLLARTARGQRELAMEHAKYFQLPFSQLIDDNAAAEQKEQGEGFDIPFYPGNSTVYEPTKSSTFTVVPHQVKIQMRQTRNVDSNLFVPFPFTAGIHVGLCRQHPLEGVSGK
jgi:hypothetical protein